MKASRPEVAAAVNAALRSAVKLQDEGRGMRRAAFLLRIEAVMHVYPKHRGAFLNEMKRFYVDQEVKHVLGDTDYSQIELLRVINKITAEVNELVEALGIPLE